MTALSVPLASTTPRAGSALPDDCLQHGDTARTVDARVAVISDAAPTRNGVGTYYTDLLAHLASHCERVRLFCPDSRTSGWYRYVGVPLPGDKYPARLFATSHQVA